MRRIKLREHDLYKLPFGRVLGDDRVVKDFRLGGVTGKARQQILKMSAHKSDPELLTNIVFVLAEEIGGAGVGERGVLERMTAADRDYMLLVATYEDAPVQEISAKCTAKGGTCPGRIDHKLDLLDLDLVLPDETDFVRQGGLWTWLARIPHKGKEVPTTFHLQTVGDVEESYRSGRPKEPFGTTFYIYSACIEAFGDSKIAESSVGDLPGRTLDAIDVALDEKNCFGVDTALEFTCPVCGETIHSSVDTVSHFFGSSPAKATKND